MTLIKINYCFHKKEKLINTMNEFSEIKRQKISLLKSNNSQKNIMNLLKLTPAALYMIENQENFDEIYN